VASLFSILSLNANKRTDIGGLHSLIRDCQPHLIFLQEISSASNLARLASAYNYQCFSSTLVQPRRPRVCAVLSRLPGTTVVELDPGHAQLVSVGALSFINIHAPTEVIRQRETLFSSLQPHLAKPISPLLVGDFNCLQHTTDRSTGLLEGHQRSPALATLLTAGEYVDSFRVLHPTARVFSFNRPGAPSSRLDRIYIPPLLESRPRVARYLPSTSDHLAYLLRLETAGLAVLPSLASKKSASLYWKFNSALLSDPTFLPAFRAFWRPLAASRPLPPAEPASAASQPPSQPPQGLQTSLKGSLTPPRCSLPSQLS